MSNSNSILIVGNNKDDIALLRTKLSLLRNIDNIVESTEHDAVAKCRQYMPETIILIDTNNDKKLINLCSNIKQDEQLKSIPVLFIIKSYDEDFMLSAFDAGMNEYVSFSASDAETLMRVIWCIKKGDFLRDLDQKKSLLSDLGVFNIQLNSYTPNYTENIFSSEINKAIKYNSPLTLMAIGLAKNNTNTIEHETLAKIINKAIRNVDIIGMPSTPQSNMFFVILPNTEKQGAYKIFERIQKSLTEGMQVCAGACELEITDSYATLSFRANQSFDLALSKGYNNIVINNIEPTENNLQSKKNFKLFKQIFNKKISTLITPVFEQAKTQLKLRYPEPIAIEHFTTQGKCYFSIKDTPNNNEAVLKISDLGLSKVSIDTFYTKQGSQSNQRDTFDIQEIDKTKLLEFIETITKEFDNFSGINIGQ